VKEKALKEAKRIHDELSQIDTMSNATGMSLYGRETMPI